MKKKASPKKHSSTTHRFYRLIAYAPVIVFIGILVGLVVHVFHPVPIFYHDGVRVIGILFLFAGPILMLWSQRSRHELYRTKAHTPDYRFLVGPYAYSRHPTYVGLVLLTVGFALLINALFVLGAAFAIFLIFHFVIIPKEESILIAHHVKGYKDYQDKVRMWL